MKDITVEIKKHEFKGTEDVQLSRLILRDSSFAVENKGDYVFRDRFHEVSEEILYYNYESKSLYSYIYDNNLYYVSIGSSEKHQIADIDLVIIELIECGMSYKEIFEVMSL